MWLHDWKNILSAKSVLSTLNSEFNAIFLLLLEENVKRRKAFETFEASFIANFVFQSTEYFSLSWLNISRLWKWVTHFGRFSFHIVLFIEGFFYLPRNSWFSTAALTRFGSDIACFLFIYIYHLKILKIIVTCIIQKETRLTLNNKMQTLCI